MRKLFRRNIEIQEIIKMRIRNLKLTTMISLLGLILLTQSSIAATRTWDGGGATNNWSENANWSGDLAPTSGDDVVFDGTSVKNATVDISMTILTYAINAGYTGTITIANGIVLTTNGGPIQNAGTLNVGGGTLNMGPNFATLNGGTLLGGTGAINVGFFLTVNGGIFNGGSSTMNIPHLNITGGSFMSTSGDLTVQSINAPAGTFGHNNGTINVTGGNASFFSNADQTVFNLDVSKNDGAALNLGNRTITVAGTLTLTEGVIFSGVIKAENAINVLAAFGTASSTEAGGTGQLLIQDGAPARTITLPAGARLPFVRLNDANTSVNTSGVGTIITQDFILDAGSVDIGSNTLSVGNLNGGVVPAFTQNGGSFSAGTGVFTNNPGNFAGQVFNNGAFNGANGTFTAEGAVSLNGGTLTAPTGTMTIKRGLTIAPAATFIHNGGTVALVFNGLSPAGLTLPAGGVNFNNLTFNLSLTLSGGNPIVNGIFTQIGGATTGGQIQMRGNMVLESTAFGGTTNILFNGTGNQTYSNNSTENFSGNWTVDKSAGTVNLANDLNLAAMATIQNLNLLNGTITTGSNKVNLGAEDITTRTNAFIIGNLTRNFNAPAMRTFDVGTANGYSPVTANVSSLVGASGLTVSATQSNRAGMDAAQSAGRFWTLTETGDLTADLTFNYLQTDVNGNEAGYKLYKWNAATPTLIAGTLDIGANTFSATGISDFSDWAIGNLVPTAANVNIGGQVLTAEGRGIPNAVLVLAGGNLTEPVFARSNPFGYYRFAGIPVGSYVITVSSKQFRFDPSSIFVAVDGNSDDLNFTARPR